MAIPYLPHMCEDALRERRTKLRPHPHTMQQSVDSASSFDLEVKVKTEEMEETDIFEGKRDSVGR